ncbi:MAG TPA: hypothetical protein VGO58_06160 [Chitinophagaceae bacterium]|jgi:hypothetical protein|nr:hypothetical protein [Chitinophagaceae bacterium]
MRFITILLLFISINGFSQWKDFSISVKGDTLNRVDMKGRKQGPWAVRVEELRGERGYEEEGYYENDQKTGTWKKFSLEGVKIAEENYSWGKLNGKQQYFTYNGGLLREESWRAIDPKIAYDTVAIFDLNDPTLKTGSIVVKNEGISMKHGKWNYWDPREGRIEATEYYVMNKLRTEDDEMIDDESIRPIDISKGKSPTDSLKKATSPTLQVIKDYEKKNSGKKKIKTRDGQTGYIPEP